MIRALMVLVCAFAVCAASIAPARATQPSCTVDRVIDGDTFVCTSGTHVRMLQMNTQEIGDCGGEWAKAALANIFLRPGTTVRLDYDQVAVDRYGRDLAAPIVTGSDGADYNISIVMVYVGLAKAAYYGDNSKYLEWANASQAWAQAAQWNMWAPGGPYNGGTNCGGGATPLPPPTGNCDPSYPDVCIPSPPPDLDCSQISERNFRVIGADPHKFDGNHDGVGCES
ncbi:MAG: thermonuclease family protein [Chloroflexi bacterium]|nr:thermonuclease family protein [Chloroflexota bacterium]